MIEPRTSFMELPVELEEAIDQLSQAVDQIMNGQKEAAGRLIASAERPAIDRYVHLVTDNLARAKLTEAPYLARNIQGAPNEVPREFRAPRHPSAAVRREVPVRDGWRCRVCGIRVANKEAIKRLTTIFPEETKWDRPERQKHQTLRLIWGVLDHVVPWARGGSSEADNLILTCNPCNYGRMNFTFEEVGIAHPFERQPVADHWDGLSRIIKP